MLDVLTTPFPLSQHASCFPKSHSVAARARNISNFRCSSRATARNIDAVDNTLSLLHSGAVTRGVPHRALRNLQLLSEPTASPPLFTSIGAWEGQLPRDDAKYQPGRVRTGGGGTKQAQRNALNARPVRMLADVIGMAEAYGAEGLVLGRAAARQRKIVRRR